MDKQSGMEGYFVFFSWYRVDDGFNFLIGLRIYEQAIADVEKAIVEALEKQYADVLAPLKENLTPKKFGLKYVQKLAKRSVCPYLVPDEVRFSYQVLSYFS